MSAGLRAESAGAPIAFGDRYVLVRKLAVGGMAEIYLARCDGPGGFEKDVVIKRLKPALARDSRVADMFVDEARVTALLGNPHNVKVFDAGIHDGVPYIAMEFIRGEELTLLCRRGLALGDFLPLEHAVELVRQAALGMGYYHNLRDADGEPLELVHCDISPTNLLVTEDGFLEIIDFGIAQFRGQSYRDEEVVPGKLSYMSPEQAQRERLDRRSDIFSLGVVLYEITVGKRLFRGAAREVYQRLTSGQLEPPTFVRRDYPGALESIVMRALEREPSERYQEAYELADDLAGFLRESGVRSGPVEIARYLDRLAVAGGGARREELIGDTDDDDDSLDFDSDLFRGYRPASDDGAGAAAEWDDVDEDESAVADALGIDVDLVRTASRSADSAVLSPPAAAGDDDPLHDDAEPAAVETPQPAADPPRRASSPAAVAPSAEIARTSSVLLLLIGLALGVTGSVVGYLLFMS